MDGKDIKRRLKDSCNGHPSSEIAWPHRVLHDAVAHIERLEAMIEIRDQEILNMKKKIPLMARGSRREGVEL